MDEKLVRTYFHELVAGLEYLHSKGIAHLDLKLDNILLGENFNLKFCGFSSLETRQDGMYNFEGTSDYRSPEIKSGICRDPFKSDIWSMAIIVFLWLYRVFPYSEDIDIGGVDLFDTLMHRPDHFFRHFMVAYNCEIETSDDFKELFLEMTRGDPNNRVSINQIKHTSWYLGAIYDEEKKVKMMRKLVKRKVTQKEIKTGKQCCSIF